MEDLKSESSKNKQNFDEEDNKKNKKGKDNKWSRLKTYQKVLIIFFSVLVLISASAAVYFYYYIARINRVIFSGTTTEIENVLTPVSTPEAPVTILFLGRDTRDAENEPGRADTIMLLHINPAEERAALLSIPRDTLVEIPGYGMDKINAAYAFGGEELMIRTVSIFLDAVINNYVTIDFDGFVKLIDELGGVKVTINRPIEDPKAGAYISAGEHNFTGEQALAYTRSRSTELGDINRIQRQQYIVKELVKQKLNMRTVSNINNYFNIIIENTRTNIDLMTIISYARAALSFGLDSIDSAIIPTYPDWIENETISVQIPDIDEARGMWQRIIFNQPISRYGVEFTGGMENVDESMVKSKYYSYDIKVKNTGALEWVSGTSEPFYLSYHWLDFNTKKPVVFDGERSMLPVAKVLPGEELEVNMKILSPPEPGNYVLQFDMVHEGRTWFSWQGVPTYEKYVAVNIDYAAVYDDMGTTPGQVRPGETFTSSVKVVNNGFMLWEQMGAQRINLGAHWYNRETREVVSHGLFRAGIPADIEHGQSAQVSLDITAPTVPGKYVLAYDLVHERVTWFSDQGVFPLEISIDVGIILDTAIVKNTTVMIYNGAGIAGAAAEFRDYIKGYGFRPFGIANAENYDFEKTIVLYKEGSEKKSQQFEKIIYSYEIEQYSDAWKSYFTGADIIVILGKDYRDNIITYD